MTGKKDEVCGERDAQRRTLPYRQIFDLNFFIVRSCGHGISGGRGGGGAVCVQSERNACGALCAQHDRLRGWSFALTMSSRFALRGT